MPLFKAWNIGSHGLAAIWQVAEDEAFFVAGTGLQPDIRNDKRRIEHLAGRYLLRQLQHDFPVHRIVKDMHDKPRLETGDFYFSVSHSWPYIAAVIDPHSETGIDIQTYHPRIAAIQHKYLSAAEQLFFGGDPQLLTLAWCAKESVYKWNGKRGVDFIQHLPISSFAAAADEYLLTINCGANETQQEVSTRNFITPDFACSYIVGHGE